MRVAVSGSSGLIGGALVRALEARGDGVVRLVRTEGGGEGTARWDPASGLLEPQRLEGVDALVHLAGAGIADKRWSEERKGLLVSSRVAATRHLLASCAELSQPPRRVLCGSAIGFYGDRGDEELDEASAGGEGFLADLCRDWEAEAQSAEAWAERVFRLRTGVVLSTAGGALPKMLTPFKLGVGGVVGSGRQQMSWISIDDEIGAILHLLDSDMESGPVNLTAPRPVSNREFTKALGGALRRPTIFPMPGFVVGIVFGEMGRDVLLGSQRVLPGRLETAGYSFAHRKVDEALASVLER